MPLYKRKAIIGFVIAGIVVAAAVLLPYILSLPLPDFMVRKMKQDIISSHETNTPESTGGLLP